MKGKIIDLFPGGNTSEGFYSFYHYILSQEEARRIFCIKGGPGTGKSTLMKRVGVHFQQKGYDIEYHHCSSDNNSLDGVVIKKLNVALLDGTAPHMVDPKNPGAVDEILNLGEHWNEETFKAHRSAIMALNKKIGQSFQRAYRFFKAAKVIQDDWIYYNQQAIDQVRLHQLEENLKNKLIPIRVNHVGNERHLFATAFSPNGIQTYIPTLLDDYNTIYVLEGQAGTGKSEILAALSKEATHRGLDSIVFHEPLVIERIEHLLIPSLHLALVTSNEINQMKLDGFIISMSDFINEQKKEIKEEIEYDRTLFYQLLQKGLDNIRHAKSLHDELESHYIPNMNFQELNAFGDEVIARIEKYEEEYFKEQE